ncbi:Hypothetical protein FKW44_016894 [Caligus rogercresseyi]|uniref:Uncharacterized protein n=1 Tax=Caligus rogercresseyi TaxID=217165 RepID=A0A7T8K0R2_CALRO|nr:Hypothetical protein FKW44_016894 [Caligus rogercresseyi]
MSISFTCLSVRLVTGQTKETLLLRDPFAFHRGNWSAQEKERQFGIIFELQCRPGSRPRLLGGPYSGYGGAQLGHS